VYHLAALQQEIVMRPATPQQVLAEYRNRQTVAFSLDGRHHRSPVIVLDGRLGVLVRRQWRPLQAEASERWGRVRISRPFVGA
jgi:hypothetical protein